MIFDINGNRLPHLTPGINIIKYHNGEIRKRYVKQ
jgi:radical SAM superfamily enzyme with C-terminal helix-hairpin-helix motif